MKQLCIVTENRVSGIVIRVKFWSSKSQVKHLVNPDLPQELVALVRAHIS